MHRKAWLVHLLAGSLAVLLYLLVPGTRGGAVLFNVVGVASVIAILVGVATHRPAKRLPWYLFAAGLSLFVAGDVVTFHYRALFHTALPFPSVADGLYLCLFPLLAAGLLLLLRSRDTSRDRTSLVDSLIVAVSAGVLSWIFLMSPYARDTDLPLARQLVSLAYPLMDLLLLWAAVRMAARGGRRGVSFDLLIAGVFTLWTTDAVYGWVQLHAGYVPGGQLDAGWLLFYVLWGAAALHPSMATLDQPTHRSVVRLSRARLVMLGVASLVPPAAQFIQSLRGEPIDATVFAYYSAGIFALVLIRMNGLVVDVRRLSEAEHQVREAEMRYRSLVEGLPAVVYLAEFGDDGKWIYVSPQIQEILGHTQEEWIDTPRIWIDNIHPEDRAKAAELEMRVRLGGGRLGCEYRFVRPDGRAVWLRDEAEAIPNERGRPTYLQGVMYDVTEQKQAETLLRQALEREREAGRHLRELDEMKNSFLQAVSHDLRTPLTTIFGMALTLEKDDGRITPEDAKDLIRRIGNNARKLHRLLTDLLDLERLTRGDLSPKRERVDVAALVRGVVEDCESDGHPLHVEAATQWVELDAVKVERIVENLVTNAIRYTPPGTPIWVRVVAEDDGVLLTVEDAGPGIPPELRELVFEPFRQGPELVQHSPGVGIGLSLVFRFAHLHGGRTWVEERPGGGASFKVFLPGAVPAAQPTPVPRAEKAVAL